MMDPTNTNNSLTVSRLKELKAMDTEFINKYESLPALWDTNHRDYNNKYFRHKALEELLAVYRKYEPEMTLYHVRKKINCLRSNYRKELKKHLASKRIGPDGADYFTFVPSNWKFYALRFLGGEAEMLEQENLEEMNMDEVDFDNSVSDVSDEKSNHEESPNIQKRRSCPSADTKKHKKIKIETNYEFLNMDETSDMELKAVAANVAYKLKRMSNEQRCQAELLINKVLYHGLKNNLTGNTDLAEVEQEQQLLQELN